MSTNWNDPNWDKITRTATDNHAKELEAQREEEERKKQAEYETQREKDGRTC